MSRKIVQENQFFLIIDNLKKLLELSEYLEVRSALIEKGLNENTFDGWKRRGRIPANGLTLISEKTGFTIEKIKGTPSLREKEKQPITKEETGFPFGVDSEKDPKLYNIVQMLKGDEETQCAIYDFLESKKHFDRASSIMRQFMMRKAGIWFAGGVGGDDHKD